jgi:transposase
MPGPDTSDRFIITADTRRRWSAEEKRAIVEEAARESRSVSRVARRHGISPSLLFRWRRELTDGNQAQALGSEPAFIPVALPAPAMAHAPQCERCGIIEIELAGGRRIRVDASVDVKVLKRVVDLLDDR